MKKRVIITGASSGFGEACAHKFAQNHHDLILLARRLDELERVKSAIENVQVEIFSVDVSHTKSVDQFINTIKGTQTNIDILVNNAGLALGLEGSHQANMADWETMVNTNILGLLHMTRGIVPTMVKRNTGHIVNIGSIAGNWPYPGSNVYGATKAFVKNFSQGLRADLSGHNIRVSNIEPGLAKTNFSNVRFKNDQQQADEIYKNTVPLTAEDVANAVYWATSMPAHVNINSIEMMPVCQTWNHLQILRDND